ncbi:MAG: DUF4190 domain-containing protein [Solirubrobacteraceae bacterium]|nr:DUF4190 domain-containing protein [Solirubrobacteraceae bacterium]
MADGDETDRPQDQPGGWLPPSAPGGEQTPPPQFQVEGLPPSTPQYPPPAQPAPPQYPPPQYQPPGGYQPPPYGQPAPGYYAPRPSRPTNGSAVAALVLGIAGIAITLMFAGILFFVSIPCSIMGWVFGVKGKKAAGEDPNDFTKPGQRGLAQAGLICGIVGLVLAVLGLAFWLLLILATDWDIDDIETEPEDRLFESAVLLARVAAPAARLLVGLG